MAHVGGPALRGRSSRHLSAWHRARRSDIASGTLNQIQRLRALSVVGFVWFMAVIRRRLGEREDQFFATGFLGSGIAFGLLTITAAVCASAPTLVVHFGGAASLDPSTVALRPLPPRTVCGSAGGA